MKKYSEIFAENLHRLRRQMKMTQEQLADKICYTEKAVSNLVPVSFSFMFSNCN